MYIEDLIDRLANNGQYIFADMLSVHTFDRPIVNSLSQQASAYTEKQRGLALKLVTKYKDQLSTTLKINVSAILEAPLFKNAIRILGSAKQIILIETADSKYIDVKFPYSSELVDLIKEYKKTLTFNEAIGIMWQDDTKTWRFDLTELNILFLSSFVENGFNADEKFVRYITEVKEIEANFINYIPMVAYEDGRFVYKNVVDKIPQPISTDLIEVLLHARKYGIHCWDDAIDQAINSDAVNINLQTIFKSNSNTVVLDHGNLNDLVAILEDGVTLFVLPGGLELDYLKTVHRFLGSKGYTNDQLSVMFRLDNSIKSGSACNLYIKDNILNNMINETTKFAFVSGKITKAILESPIKIDNVIHFGTSSAHYTLRNYVRNHHNVISFTLTHTTMELPFGNL